MHEDLLGYLLGALEPHEMRRVDRWLRDDPDARRQLAEIERLLRPLQDQPQPLEFPPPDLISRTMASLPSSAAPTESPNVVSSAMATASLAPMQENIDPPRARGWTWFDWSASASAAAIVLALILPAIAEGRFEARKTACQDQLRRLGIAITQFVSRNEHSRLPAVSDSGPEAFAGVYAPRLRDAGLMEDESIRWCPSLDLPNKLDMTDAAIQLVSVSQLHDASFERLRQIQQFAGGQYAYTLGVIERDRLASPRFESRSTFAVMSDAPLAGMPTQSNLADSFGHGGVGINILFEDGRVQFVATESLGTVPDHPLLNHRGDAEAGVNIDDASLAPSWHPPFENVLQR